MKNIINYYYNFKITKYKKNNTKFVFEENEVEYEFVEYYGNVNNLINVYRFVKENDLCNEIILNKNNEIITIYENKPFILIKKKKYPDIKNLLNETLKFHSIVSLNDKLKWKGLWSYKLDYFQTKIEEIDKFKLKFDFSYYSALCECAINLLNFVNENNLKFVITHSRLENKADFFNPLNLIIDVRVRDIAEYIKINFFKNRVIDNEIFNLINQNIFSQDEIILLLSRLLYPSYFFDEFERILEKNESYEKLKIIIKKNLDYENFLKKIYFEMNKNYKLPQIEFLEN